MNIALEARAYLKWLLFYIIVRNKLLNIIIEYYCLIFLLNINSLLKGVHVRPNRFKFTMLDRTPP